MYYVRAGLPIQELAFLGRWKSNVVLQDADEALQDKAVVVPDLQKDGAAEGKSEPKTQREPEPFVGQVARTAPIPAISTGPLGGD